ncbi:hypothetical protein K438DRAFT_1754777 [Mycena galopus ATCC 62051]|nr:hypothetical protein K438DRAFT_1754777 [Mycena galopus ATCC 62051]
MPQRDFFRLRSHRSNTFHTAQAVTSANGYRKSKHRGIGFCNTTRMSTEELWNHDTNRLTITMTESIRKSQKVTPAPFLAHRSPRKLVTHKKGSQDGSRLDLSQEREEEAKILSKTYRPVTVLAASRTTTAVDHFAHYDPESKGGYQLRSRRTAEELDGRIGALRRNNMGGDDRIGKQRRKRDQPFERMLNG